MVRPCYGRSKEVGAEVGAAIHRNTGETRPWAPDIAASKEQLVLKDIAEAATDEDEGADSESIQRSTSSACQAGC